MSSIIINIPSGPKEGWSSAQLVRVGHDIVGVERVHLEDIKVVLRDRVGPDGGKVTDGDKLSVTVGRLAKPAPKTNWAQVGKDAIVALKVLDPKAATDIVVANTEESKPSAQSVRF